MQKIIATIEITRPINLVITFLVVYVSAVICGIGFEIYSQIFLACLAAVFVAASGNVINDYFDVEIDKINRPERPIPSGRITKRNAVFFYLLLSSSAIIISLVISFEALFVVLVTIILLYFYSERLKGIPLIGNIVVSFCTALAFIFGGMVVGNYEGALIPALFAFLINFIREILKDMEDLDGDKLNNQLTFPVKYGIESGKKLILGLILFLVVVTFVPFILKLYIIEYFLVVLFCVDLPLIFFSKQIFSNDFITNLSKLSLSLKVIMIFGLIAIYVGKI